MIGSFVLALVGGVLLGGGPARADLVPLPEEGPLPVPPVLGPAKPQPAPKPRPRPHPEPEHDCSTAVAPFVPETIEIDVLQAWVPVLAMRRDDDGVPGTPPATSRGRGQMAFDLDNVRPGSRRGNALLNAHTWPDGTAIGNALLAELHEGDEFALTGPGGRICYRVGDRVEVRAGDLDARERYFARSGRPQAAIVVCSGRRLGPGQWTHRTMWFASPLP